MDERDGGGRGRGVSRGPRGRAGAGVSRVSWGRGGGWESNGAGFRGANASAGSGRARGVPPSAAAAARVRESLSRRWPRGGGGPRAYLVRRAKAVTRAVVPQVLAHLARTLDAHGERITEERAPRARLRTRDKRPLCAGVAASSAPAVRHLMSSQQKPRGATFQRDEEIFFPDRLQFSCEVPLTNGRPRTFARAHPTRFFCAP